MSESRNIDEEDDKVYEGMRRVEGHVSAAVSTVTAASLPYVNCHPLGAFGAILEHKVVDVLTNVHIESSLYCFRKLMFTRRASKTNVLQLVVTMTLGVKVSTRGGDRERRDDLQKKKRGRNRRTTTSSSPFLSPFPRRKKKRKSCRVEARHKERKSRTAGGGEEGHRRRAGVRRVPIRILNHDDQNESMAELWARTRLSRLSPGTRRVDCFIFITNAWRDTGDPRNRLLLKDICFIDILELWCSWIPVSSELLILVTSYLFKYSVELFDQ